MTHPRSEIPCWPDGRPRWVILPGRGVGVRARAQRILYTPHPEGNRGHRRAKAAARRLYAELTP